MSATLVVVEVALTRQSDGHRLVSHDNFAATDLNGADVVKPLLHHEFDGVTSDSDANAATVKGDPINELFPLIGQPRVDAVAALIITETAEAVHERGPHTAGGGNVHTVFRVPVQVA